MNHIVYCTILLKKKYCKVCSETLSGMTNLKKIKTQWFLFCCIFHEKTKLKIDNSGERQFVSP